MIFFFSFLGTTLILTDPRFNIDLEKSTSTYTLRIEDIQEFNFEQYIKQFQISKQILDNSPDDLIVLHPMPINVGIEISEEASLHNKFKYQEQLRLGIASRIASYKFALELI